MIKSIEISKAMSLCINNGVRIYPVISMGKYVKIEVNNNGRKHTYPEEFHRAKDINNSIIEKYKYYSNKILKQIS
ncbi:hypothetical protein [Tenacibaculum sp. 190524A05c]|uniref:hypothetical protein n=1 Tax=Tenacibaculum platacis TaxID=3137852 RepID=UPI0031FAB303